MNKDQQPQEPQYFKTRIGSTYYKVAVYPSNISKEHIQDKILRLAKSDAAKLAKAPTAEKAVEQ